MSSNKYLLFCTFLIVINCSGSKKNSESDSNEPEVDLAFNYPEDNILPNDLKEVPLKMEASNETHIHNGFSETKPEPQIYKYFFNAHFGTSGALQFLGPWRQRSGGVNFNWKTPVPKPKWPHKTDKNHYHHLHIGYDP